jgi:hypothetical protein
MPTAEYMREYYARPGKKEKVVARVRRYRAERQQFLLDYKAEQGCARCPERDPRCLVFHHLRDKKYQIAQMPTNGFSLEKIRAEIEKCEVLCANCHSKHHSVHGRNN